MKKYNLIPLLIGVCSLAYSQNPVAPDLTKGHVPSPEAYAMMQYEEIPVSLYSGVPSISIPVYTIKVGDYSLPISLNYHASGIKIAQEASRVGLGWSLFAGGSITRSRRGDDDGQDFYVSTDPVPTVNYSADSLTYTVDGNYLDGGGQLRSLEPDMFYYNFGGYSGKFYPKRSGSTLSPGSKRFMLSNPEHNLKIEPIQGAISYGFIITTPENVKYIFSNTELSYSYGSTYSGVQLANCPGLDTDVIPSSFTPGNNISLWCLTRIEYPTGDKIYFDYTSEDYLSPLWQSSQKTEIRCTEGWGNMSQYYALLPFDGRSISNSMEYHTGPVCLKSIRWKDGRLDFIPGETRKDIRNHPYRGIGKEPKTLASIRLFKKDGTTPLLTYSFHYSYFSGKNTHGVVTTADHLRSRLKLTGISLKGTGNTTQNYQMEYNDSEPLPQKNSYSCDTWGYFNDSDPNNPYSAFKANFDCFGLEKVNNQIHTSKNKCISKGQVFGEGDKAPNTKALLGMLTALTTPTGGRTEFKYECNRILDNLEWKKESSPSYKFLNKEKNEDYVTDTIYMPFDGYLDIACSYTGTSSNCLEKEKTTALISISNGWRLQGLSATPNQNMETPPNYRYLIREKVECKKGTYQIVLHTQLKASLLVVAIEKYKGTVTARESIAGGVRIAEIKSPLGTKKFNYTDHAGRSTGRLNRNPPFNRIVLYTMSTGWGIAGTNIELIAGYYAGIEFNSISLLPMENPHNNYSMGYTEVTTTQESGEGNLVEKSYFYNEKDPKILTLNDPGTVMPLNGNLLERQIFSGGELLQKTVYNYEYRLLDRELGFKTKQFNAPVNYYTPEYFVYKSSVADTRYEKMPNGKRTAYPILTGYEYSQKNYQPRRILETKGGVTREHRIFYTVDDNYGPNYGDAFKKYNLVNAPVEEYFTTGSSQSKLLCHINYKDSLLKPWKEYVFYGWKLLFEYPYFNGSNSLDRYKPEITYLTYDKCGRNTSYATRMGQTVVLIWGYQHQHIIAQIANSTIAAITAQGIDMDAIAGRDIPTDADWQKLHALRAKLPQSSVTVTQYEPLIGAVSQTDPRGVVTRYTYDEFGRLKEAIENVNGTENVLQKIEYKYANDK